MMDAHLVGIRLVFPIHHLIFGKLGTVIHFIDGLHYFHAGWLFNVELVAELLLQLIQLDEVGLDVIILVP